MDKSKFLYKNYVYFMLKAHKYATSIAKKAKK